ncbi:hypothetical protein GCM10022199_13810 [Marihabitans asiaticum]|uniref:O-antigen/teichoic acid export membrane protein n=1 Tax=Marihabitans asiaticum TaxID=415218 RepID=A0A560W8H1_9MICO|nr:oligosaccharide flippase family protein [Marihabitans asiaticum]TWD13923.1 O-antigen/teichoic acid export membrane protein [Marihabitans asiaticum]
MTTTDARQMTRAGLTLGVGEIIGKLATLVMLGVLARVLGVADFGVFSLGLGLGVLLGAVATLGMDQRLVQLAGQEPESLSARLSSLLALRLTLALAVIAGAAVVLPQVLSDWREALVAIILVVAGSTDSIIEAFRSAASSRHHQSGPAVVLVIQRCLALVLVLTALHLDGGMVGAAGAYLLAAAVGALLMAVTAYRGADILPRPRLVSRAHVRDFTAAIRVTGLNELTAMALFRVDVLLIAWLAGTVAVGHYTAAYRLLETVLFISWSVTRVILPALADSSPASPDRSRTMTGALVIVIAAYLPYGAVLLVRGDEILGLLFGAPFADPTIIGWLALAPLLFAIAQIYTSALLAVRPDPAVLAASVAALVVDIGLGLLLIPRWGAPAAAAATTLSYAVQAVVVVRALGGVVAAAALIRSVLVCLAATLLALLTMLLPLPLLPALVLAGVVYTVIWWTATTRWDRPTHQLVRTVTRRGVPG